MRLRKWGDAIWIWGKFTCDISFPLVAHLAGRTPEILCHISLIFESLSTRHLFIGDWLDQNHLLGLLSLLPPAIGGSFSSSNRISLPIELHKKCLQGIFYIHNLFVSSVPRRPPWPAPVQLGSPLRWKQGPSSEGKSPVQDHWRKVI